MLNAATSLIVVGAGAEDTESALARAITSFTMAGGAAVAFDPSIASRSSQSGTPSSTLRWLLKSSQPEAIVNVDGALEEFCAEVDCSAFSVFPLDAAAATAALLHLGGNSESDASSAIYVKDVSPRVSIVLALYNREGYARAALESCLSQLDGDVEVVTYDDGSRDGTAKVLEDFSSDPRVKQLRCENIGQTGRMDLILNLLVRASRGELVAFMGDDDINESNRIERQLTAFANDPGLGICHTAAWAMDSSGSVVGSTFALPHAYDDASIFRQLLPGCFVGHPSVMMKRSVFDRLGGFREGLTCDYDFWLRAAPSTRFRYLPERLVRYRFHEASLSTSSKGLPRIIEETTRIRRQALGRSTALDFYPEVAQAPFAGAEAEALISMGLTLSSVDLEASLELMKRSLDAHPTDRAQRNIEVLTKRLSGETEGCADTALLGASSEFSAWVQKSQHAWTNCIAWDGAAKAPSTGYLSLGNPASKESAAAMRAWSDSTRQGDPIRWVIPTLGRTETEVFNDVLLAARDTPLNESADLTIMRADDLQFIPCRSGDGRGVITFPSDVEAMAHWLARSLASSR